MMRQSQQTAQTKITATETQEPSPTEQPEIDKKSVKIQVINGTGTPGQASTAVEALEEAGYNADNITTGNAEEFSTTDTTITAREGFETIARDIKDILEGEFDDVAVASSSLDEDEEFDIVIVTGGEEFEEVTPTKGAGTTTTPPAAISTPGPTSSPTPRP